MKKDRLIKHIVDKEDNQVIKNILIDLIMSDDSVKEQVEMRLFKYG